MDFNPVAKLFLKALYFVGFPLLIPSLLQRGPRGLSIRPKRIGGTVGLLKRPRATTRILRAYLIRLG